jgi:hypothetical protein
MPTPSLRLRFPTGGMVVAPADKRTSLTQGIDQQVLRI